MTMSRGTRKIQNFRYLVHTEFGFDSKIFAVHSGLEQGNLLVPFWPTFQSISKRQEPDPDYAILCL
jgi:hypothetical protein